MAKLAAMLLYLSLIVAIFNATPAAAQCRGDLQGLIKQCGKYVKIDGPRENPSPECCGVVKNVDVPCVCAHIPPRADQMISMAKAMFVVTACGTHLPPGSRCGSYRVPPN